MSSTACPAVIAAQQPCINIDSSHSNLSISFSDCLIQTLAAIEVSSPATRQHATRAFQQRQRHTICCSSFLSSSGMRCTLFILSDNVRHRTSSSFSFDGSASTACTLASASASALSQCLCSSSSFNIDLAPLAAVSASKFRLYLGSSHSSAASSAPVWYFDFTFRRQHIKNNHRQ
jgi:hypothetical protein